MKRFHVHVNVDELDAGIDFYPALLGTTPVGANTRCRDFR